VPGAPFHGTPERNVILDATAAKRLLSAMPKKARIPVLGAIQVSKNGSDHTFTIAATDLQTPSVTVVDMTDRTFPDYSRIMPAADKPGTVGVTMGWPVLDAIVKSAKAAGAKGIRFEIPTAPADRADRNATDPGDVMGSIRFTIKGADVNVTGVAMPMRL
jgi:hypothetical protein